MRIKIEGHPNLRRDGHSNAVVNTDVEAYENAVARHRAQSTIEQRLNALESDIGDIKLLLQQLVRLK